MAGTGEKQGPDTRAERLSRALRENLRRRKQQARRRNEPPSSAGESDAPADDEAPETD